QRSQDLACPRLVSRDPPLPRAARAHRIDGTRRSSDMPAFRGTSLVALVALAPFAFASAAIPPIETPTPGGFPSVTKPIHDVELAFAMPGRLELLAFKPGDKVAAGTLIARLEDDELEAQVALSEIRANDQATIKAAKAARDQAEDLRSRVERAFAD